MLLVTWAMLHLFGQTLFANLIAAPPTVGLGATPTFAELTALALPNTALAVLLLAAFTVWGFAWVGPTAMCASRCVFAWSLDGLAPAWLRGVHKRWHTPHHALYVIFGLSAFWTVLLVYGKLMLLSGMSVMVIEWLAVALCGILLPRVDAPLWELTSPGRRLGLPTIAWWGLLTIPPVLVIAWLNLTDLNSGTSLAWPAERAGHLDGDPRRQLRRVLRRRRAAASARRRRRSRLRGRAARVRLAAPGRRRDSTHAKPSSGVSSPRCRQNCRFGRNAPTRTRFRRCRRRPRR